MVCVDVCIAERMSENAGLQVTFLGDHMHQNSVAGDVERYAQREIGAALVKLAVQPAVYDIELEKQMTGRQGHFVQIGDVPGVHDNPA